MPYQYSTRHLPYQGMELRRDQRSILAQMLTPWKVFLTDQQRISHRHNTEDLMRKVDAHARGVDFPALERTTSSILTSADFSSPPADAFYKYVPERSWQFIQRGSFQFGSPEYYRRVENPFIQDWFEGFATLHFLSDICEVSIALRAGSNCAVFCGTGEVNGTNHNRMMRQFSDEGGKCLKISPVDEFATHIKRRLRAFRVRQHDVVYTDAKVATVQSSAADGLRALFDHTSLDMRFVIMNREFFATFYDAAILPCLFAKPYSYAHERERRLIFELRGDLRQDVVRLNDPELLQFVEVVDKTGPGV